MKKVLSLFLAFVLCFCTLCTPASAKAGNDAIAPCYTNAIVVNTVLSITDTGLATVDEYCTGISTTTSIKVVTYLERYVGGLWARVDISPINDEWIGWTNATYYTRVRTHQLESRGSYRAVTVFTVAAGTSETITRYSYATY